MDRFRRECALLKTSDIQTLFSTRTFRLGSHQMLAKLDMERERQR